MIVQENKVECVIVPSQPEIVESIRIPQQLIGDYELMLMRVDKASLRAQCNLTSDLFFTSTHFKKAELMSFNLQPPIPKSKLLLQLSQINLNCSSTLAHNGETLKKLRLKTLPSLVSQQHLHIIIIRIPSTVKRILNSIRVNITINLKMLPLGNQVL
jgi:hypothetical protein